MGRSASKRIAFASILVMASLGVGTSAHANDFLSSLFGAFTGHAPPIAPQPLERLSYAPDGTDGSLSPSSAPIAPRPASSGGRQAFCVRTCDGRYFPVEVADGQSRAASCNSFCPASETKVFYGSNIDRAASEGGKRYSELPNAFKYRSEIVAGCTCNGKDQFGLAKIDIQEDHTVRKGDLVAGADGLMVAGRRDRRGASLNLSPASASLRARYERVPVVASD